MKLQLVSSPRKHLNCRIILKWLKGKFLFDSFTYDPRTNDTHPSHQYENHLPTKYFHDLAIEFERKLMIYRSQIDQLEAHLAVGGETGTESNLIRPFTDVFSFIRIANGVRKTSPNIYRPSSWCSNYNHSVGKSKAEVPQLQVKATTEIKKNIKF